MRIRTRPVVLALGLSMIFTAAAAHQQGGKPAAELSRRLSSQRDTVGGPFALIDQQGKPRTDADFRGKLMLVYFGFTQCPDICPLDLQQIGQAIEKLGPSGDALQPIFITLDPARDTSEHLAAYVPSFHPRLVGLGGSAEAVAQVARGYRIQYKKVATKSGDYTIAHATAIYLMDRDGKYLAFFPPGIQADRLARLIRPYLGPQ
jgi:cytochrome oxidase Cu insertion factor (SCO1/SenC/PrrC family)